MEADAARLGPDDDGYGARTADERGETVAELVRQDERGCYENRQRSPDSNAFRIRRATTMRCTSSGPS